jgi:hypothetical protein
VAFSETLRIIGYALKNMQLRRVAAERFGNSAWGFPALSLSKGAPGRPLIL